MARKVSPKLQRNHIGLDGFIWAIGVVESREDPLLLGRCRVRYFGWHPENKDLVPTKKLPWSIPMCDLDYGRNSVGPKEGDWIIGFFRDGIVAQEPVMMGIMPGIPEIEADPSKGFNDPRPDSMLNGHIVPRNPKSHPKQYDTGKGSKYKTLEKVSRFPQNEPLDKKLRYVDQKEATTSRYERAEFVKQTIVKVKKKNREIGQINVPEDSDTPNNAEHPNSHVGSDVESPCVYFDEPETPYATKYPYNHTYFSESGHLIEIDDTPDAERLQWYHRAGTFREIHPSGLQVEKIVDKEHHIVLKGRYTHIEADDIKTVDGQSQVMINKNRKPGHNYDLTVGENANANLTVKKGDRNLYCIDGNQNVRLGGGGGTYSFLYEKHELGKIIRTKKIWIGENYIVDVMGNTIITTTHDTTIISKQGNVNVEAGGNVNVKAGGVINVQAGSNVTVNTGGSATVNAAVDISLMAGRNITLQAGGNIGLLCGGTMTISSGMGRVDNVGGSHNVNVLGGLFQAVTGAASLQCTGNLDFGTKGSLTTKASGIASMLAGGLFNMVSPTINIGSSGTNTLNMTSAGPVNLDSSAALNISAVVSKINNEIVVTAGDNFKKIFAGLVTQLETLLGDLTNVDLFDVLAYVQAAVTQAVTDRINAVLAAYGLSLGSIDFSIDGMIAAVKTAVQTAINSFIQQTINEINAVVNNAMAILESNLNSLKNLTVSNIVSTLTNNLINEVNGVLDAATTLALMPLNIMADIQTAISPANINNIITSSISNSIESVTDLSESNVFSNLESNLQSVTSNLTSDITNSINSVSNSIANKANFNSKLSAKITSTSNQVSNSIASSTANMLKVSDIVESINSKVTANISSKISGAIERTITKLSNDPELVDEVNELKANAESIKIAVIKSITETVSISVTKQFAAKAKTITTAVDAKTGFEYGTGSTVYVMFIIPETVVNTSNVKCVIKDLKGNVIEEGVQATIYNNNRALYNFSKDETYYSNIASKLLIQYGTDEVVIDSPLFSCKSLLDI